MKIEPGKQRVGIGGKLWALPILLASSAACSQSPTPEVRSATVNTSEGIAVAQGSEQAPVANLPFSQGRSFSSLDEYLKFLQTRGAYDVPWYREIRPGVYELVSRRGPGAQPQIYTRAELARKFGFQE